MKVGTKITPDAWPPLEGGASFPLKHRAYRALFQIVWLALARWTPPFLNPWRCLILKAFGARIGKAAMVYSSARIWYPAHLNMGHRATLGPRVNCYNIAPIHLGAYAVISQDAELVTGSHDVDNPAHSLTAAPIVIGPSCWVAAGAFVGPGVVMEAFSVLGARSVCFSACRRGGIYVGNPASLLRERKGFAAQD
ncbi:putative colanic acid biosynthesis acetyltransferase [Altererythrobacter indicus]|uniref:Putative colanic acid biosynthesis acetyltransferase n=1 Tax=Altericroceibacterium indicum TaxID=374177 RepID=A0A845A8R4_9SPHN|nr:putative colanic acid biosynthesis acetyltransferase [Altericroceibacterium indicum]MXP26630.1 putative colanic acid biosynthesis acetyltransferase [Altericroceibacterium indicum]